MDPLSFSVHVGAAVYCIAIAMLVALLLLADATADYHRELKNRPRRGKKWWEK
jgi:hypothetical protein